jgi:hypothetical protein
LAKARVRYGYFRIYILLRRDGWMVNHKQGLSIVPRGWAEPPAQTAPPAVSAATWERQPAATKPNELWPLVGPAAFGYSVDFWNSDLIASCVAAACLVTAGFFFATKPPQIRLRRADICRPQLRRTRMPGFSSFRPLALPTA